MNGGYYTIDSMRLEKGYRAFGRELTPDYNPVEAGLMFACKLKTDIPFLGREAVEQAKSDGPRRKLVSFVLGSPDPMLWGGELVLRDGQASGQVISAAWGETLGACVGLAYLWDPDGNRIDRRLGQAGRLRGRRQRHPRTGLGLAPAALRPGREQDQGVSKSSRVLNGPSAPQGRAHDSINEGAWIGECQQDGDEYSRCGWSSRRPTTRTPSPSTATSSALPRSSSWTGSPASASRFSTSAAPRSRSPTPNRWP